MWSGEQIMFNAFFLENLVMLGAGSLILFFYFLETERDVYHIFVLKVLQSKNAPCSELLAANFSCQTWV